jgi:hypothetical protein
MNALAHCAEALYTTGRAEETDPEALSDLPEVLHVTRGQPP